MLWTATPSAPLSTLMGTQPLYVSLAVASELDSGRTQKLNSGDHLVSNQKFYVNLSYMNLSSFSIVTLYMGPCKSPIFIQGARPPPSIGIAPKSSYLPQSASLETLEPILSDASRTKTAWEITNPHGGL